MKRCCFAGHSDSFDSLCKEKVMKIAESLVVNQNVKEFWVGNYGAFDSCASSAIKELQKNYDDIILDLVIPYLTKSIIINKELHLKKYDQILIADIPQNTPKRFYVTKTNEYIVDNCDFLICNVQQHFGGAFTTYKYAKRKDLQIYNIAEKELE